MCKSIWIHTVSFNSPTKKKLSSCLLQKGVGKMWKGILLF